MSMEELSKPDKRLEVKGKVHCKEFGHEERALKFYCGTCDLLICRYCMDFNHPRPEHVCNVVKAVAHKNRELVTASNKNLEKQLEKAEQYLTQLSFATNRVEMATQDGKSKVVALKEGMLKMINDQLEEKSKDMIADIDRIQDVKLGKLKRQTEDTKAYVTNIEGCIQSSAKLLEEGTDEEMILTKKRVHDAEERILAQSSKHSKLPVTKNFGVKVTDHSYVPGAIASILTSLTSLMGNVNNESVAVQERAPPKIEEISEKVGDSPISCPEPPFTQEFLMAQFDQKTSSKSSGKKGLCSSYNGTKLVVYQGKITNEKTDAIVMPIRMDRYEDVKNFMPINFGDVVIVEEVGFHCKMVLYVIGLTEDGEPKKGGVPLLQKIITNSLVLATKERANSISISAIGSMLDGVTAEECAVTTLNTVEKFLKSCNKSIQEIHFVNEEEETSIAFAGELCAKHQAFEIPISDLDIESDDEHDPLNQYSDYDFEKPDSDDECCQAVFDVLLGKEVQRIDTEF